MKIVTEHKKYIEIDPEGAKALAQRLHIKKDEIPFVRKFYIAEKGEVNEGERSVVARVSSIERDREGEIIEPTGIDVSQYTKNPVLMWAHRYQDPPIGTALWTRSDEKGLIAKFRFAKTQFADEIYQLYKDGILKAFSIGFIPLDFDEETKIHKKISLLEVSAVPVPANQDALVMEAYQKGIIKSEKLKKDLEIEIEKESESSEPVSDRVIEIEKEVVTKPETTAEYHHIPVSEGHGDHEIKTITISAEKGIKALYCVTCKKIKTYLFDVDKWSMEEAQAWVKEHKEDGKQLTDESTKLIGDMTEEMIRGDDEIRKTDKFSINIRMTDLPEFKAWEQKIQNEITEIKEGRVLSTKNRTLVKQVMDQLTELRDVLEELYKATEPTQIEEGSEERQIEIVRESERMIEIEKAEKANERTAEKAQMPTREEMLEMLNKAVDQAIKNLDIKAIIDNAVKAQIAYMRGKIREKK